MQISPHLEKLLNLFMARYTKYVSILMGNVIE